LWQEPYFQCYNELVTYLATFYTSLTAILVLIAVGFTLGKLRIVNEAANKVFANLLLSVAMPCALFSAFPSQFDQDSFVLFIQAVVGALAMMVTAIFVSRFLFRQKKIGNTFHQHQFAFIFNNASFLGYPLTVAVFGAQSGALVAYSGLMLVFNFALFSYGVWLFQKRLTLKHFLHIIFNPNIIAVTLGFIFFLISYQPMPFITSSVTYLANLTTPLSLISIGFMLHLVHDWGSIFRKHQLFITCLLQLLLMPTLTFLLATILRLPEIIRLIFTMIQALPTATSLGLFAEKYRGHKVEASELVLISTVLSVITLPLVMTLVLRS
jgi:predicted permease